MRRIGLGTLAALLLAACSTVLVPRADVDDVVRGAFSSAGLRADRVTVEGAREGSSWRVSATVNGADVDLVVDAEAGRITRIELGDSATIARDKLREIARYESNPANDRARTRRRVVGLVAVVALIAGGLLVARHFRLREERELADRDEEL